MDHDNLDIILRMIGISVVIVVIFRRLRLPPILGYLFVGVFAGPHALSWVPDSPTVHSLGEIGIAFLLFMIGLDFSVPKFLSMWRTLVGLGGTQVLAGTACGALIGWMLGVEWGPAIIIGGALAMSSTAIVVKQLTDQLELHSTHGRFALGILLFQDLAAIPFLVVIPILAGGITNDLTELLLIAVLKAALALSILAALGRWALRPLFHEVAAAGSGELFTLAVLLVSLAAAWITELLGLSLALGAFFAGMMLSETEYRHQIEAAIRPFRDILLGLFFITVGMQLNVAQLLPNAWWIILIVAGLILGKGSLIAFLTYLTGHSVQESARTGMVLAHAGEFGFALFALAFSTGLISSSEAQPILAAAIISMTVSPLLIKFNGTFSRKFFPEPDNHKFHSLPEVINNPDLRDHVIICGYGRVGRAIAEFLRDEKVPYVALDLDIANIRRGQNELEVVHFADATRREILEAVGAKHAKAMIISFDDPAAALKVLHQAHFIRRDLPIIVRARDNQDLSRLYEAGAEDVVPEVQEVSMMLTIRLMLLLNISPEEIVRNMRSVREERYKLLRTLFGNADDDATR